MSIQFIEPTEPHRFQWLGFRMVSLSREPYPCVIQLKIPGFSLLMSDGVYWFLEMLQPSHADINAIALDIYRHIDEDKAIRGI